MAEGIVLRTERLVVRDHIPEDLEPMHLLMSDPEAMHFLPELFSPDINKTAKNLAEAMAQSRSDDRQKFFFAVENGSTGEYIGEVGYTVTYRSPGGSLANLGYFIHPVFFGNGFTTEAVKAVLRYAFTEGGIHKLNTGCLVENKASERVMIKCGFRREALLRAHQLHADCWKDRLEYGLTREEYLAQTD